MQRGVNLGNALEAPYEGAWGVILREEYFRLIREAGFDTVRIPIRWSAHANPVPPYTIDERFFRRVDWAIDQALLHGLTVIINVHHYDELMTNPEEHRERFLALWDQIARRYAARPATLLFELLNEPHARLTAPVWNQLLAEALQVVRQTNPTRWVVIGPTQWNHVRSLPSLELPKEDPHIIVTFHYYEPFPFTHQGASWVPGSMVWLGTKWEGREEERQTIVQDLDFAVLWAREQNRPLFLGEFGAYSRADLPSRVRWTEFVARQAEARGIPWCYWEFCSGFGIYDPRTQRWRDQLLWALIPRP
nr:endoglucanase [uncultured bacterium]